MTPRRSIVWTLSAFLAASMIQADDKQAKDKLAPAKCGAIERLHAQAGTFLAGQPKPEDFKIARDKGIKVVINLREKSELDFDEEAVVTQLGMKYVHAPFKAPETLTDEVFEKTRSALALRAKEPVLMHCGSANRVGAIWLVHRVLDDKLPFEQALEEAKTVGLKTPAYIDKAKDYITRKRKKC